MLTHMLRAANKATFVSVASTGPTATASSLVIGRPANTVEGDFLVNVCIADTGSVTWTSTGWTEVLDANGLRIAYRVATASESASYIFTASTARVLLGCVLCYRGAAFDSIGATDTTSPYTPAGVTMTNFGLLLGVVGRAGSSSQTLTLPASMTSRFNSSPSGPTLAVGDEIVQLGATGSSRTFTSTNTNSVTAVLVGLKTG